jgi:hypothetical protein
MKSGAGMGWRFSLSGFSGLILFADTMATIKITKESIKDALASTDDFKFEMLVGEALKSVRPHPHSAHPVEFSAPDHSGTYTDHLTGKTRQFDYRCQIIRATSRWREKVLLAVECKNLNPEVPLLISGTMRTAKESYHMLIESYAHTTDRKNSLEIRSQPSRVYKNGGFVGKKTSRFKVKGEKIEFLSNDTEKETYDKWSQAISSLFDPALEAVIRNPTADSRAFAMPIVVVPDKTLWEVCYNDDGTFQDDPLQVESCEYWVEKEMKIALPFVLTHIHFFTLGGFSRFLNHLANPDSLKWHEIFAYDSVTVYQRP